MRFDDQPIERDRLERMRDQLRHRGPDGEGINIYDRCGFAHTRLSIIDLLSGLQPMHVPECDSKAGLSLIFNGEIYNHRDLRRKLERLGHSFASSHSDTEVLLFGYRQWGHDLPKLLHGMFAFAIWDHTDRSLFLCRDRAGKKPLYLWQRDTEVVFGSLVSSLIVSRGDRPLPGIDPQAALTFLRLGYTHRHAIFEDIDELPAAHWMKITQDRQITTGQYWRPPPISRTSTSVGAQSGLTEILEEAIDRRLESDVPLGCFLSGGIDSSVVAAIAQRNLKGRDKPALQTFNIAMPHADYDESDYARAVADHIGSEHTVLQARSDAVMDDLKRLIAVCGEPTADSSILPTLWLSRATRQHVKAVLSGDGGDELFGGYDRYRAMRLLTKHGNLLRMVPAMWLADTRPYSTRTRLRRLAEAARQQDPQTQYRSMIQLFTDKQIRRLAPDAVAEAIDRTEPGVPDWPDAPEPLEAAKRWDLMHYLPFDLLRKVDRASMAVGLEVRCPLLDTQVCDFAGHLPNSVLMPGGRPKGLLRQVAAQYIPKPLANRAKSGFAVPVGEWFRTSLRDELRDTLTDGTLSGLGFDAGYAAELADEHADNKANHTHGLFALLTLALWGRWQQEPTAPPVGIS